MLCLYASPVDLPGLTRLQRRLGPGPGQPLYVDWDGDARPGLAWAAAAAVRRGNWGEKLFNVSMNL